MNNIINKIDKIDLVKTFDNLNPNTQNNLVKFASACIVTKAIVHIFDNDKFQNLSLKVKDIIDIEINNQNKKITTVS